MYKYQWISMNINKHHRITINMNEYEWISININKSRLISMNTNEYQWISMDIVAYQQIYMSINKYQSISIKINEHQWILTNINEYHWTYMNTNDYQWLSKNIWRPECWKWYYTQWKINHSHQWMTSESVWNLQNAQITMKKQTGRTCYDFHFMGGCRANQQ